MSERTEYTDPTTIDVDVVRGNINHDFKMRGHTWTDRLSWPNVTVKALVDEIARLENEMEEAGTEGALAIARCLALTATVQRIADGDGDALTATVQRIADGDGDPQGLARTILEALALHRVLP